jgi:hypothetical protein
MHGLRNIAKAGCHVALKAFAANGAEQLMQLWKLGHARACRL